MPSNDFRTAWYLSGVRFVGLILPAPPWMISRGLILGHDWACCWGRLYSISMRNRALLAKSQFAKLVQTAQSPYDAVKGYAVVVCSLRIPRRCRLSLSLCPRLPMLGPEAWRREGRHFPFTADDHFLVQHVEPVDRCCFASKTFTRLQCHAADKDDNSFDGH